MAKTSRKNELNKEDLFAAIARRGPRGLTTKQLVNQIAAETGIERSEARRRLRPVLKTLQRDGRVVLGRGKRYFAAEASDLISGRLRSVPGGHIELKADTSDGPPIRIPPRGMRGGLEGDTVLVRIESPRKKARADGVREGVVVRVVERGRREVVGRWMVGGGRPHVRPLERRLRFTVTPTKSRVEGEPLEGELVVTSIDSVDSKGKHARGTLLERLGQAADPGVVEQTVLRPHVIDPVFSDAAIR